MSRICQNADFAIKDVDTDFIGGLFSALSNSPFFIKDSQLRYVQANAAMARLCGVQSERHLLGKRAHDFFPVSLALHYEALDRNVLIYGKQFSNLVERSVRRRGQAVWLIFSRVPVRNKQGEVVGIAAIARQLGEDILSAKVGKRLQAAVAEIRSQYNQPLAIDVLACRIGVSASQLQRDFKAAFSMSPRTFQRKLRIERSIEMLEGTDSIATIAYACGFSDQSAFTRSFSSEMGTSPAAYRKFAKTTGRLRLHP